MSRILRTAAVALACAFAVAAAPASASADVTVPIGPNQYFSGLVNDSTGPVAIQMACYGPVVPGQTGHPLPGQSVEVLRASGPSGTWVGYTGSAANSVLVTFSTSSTASGVVLSYYGVKAEIPTTLTLPCSGTGTVSFNPRPASSTSYPATVKVSYVGQP